MISRARFVKCCATLAAVFLLSGCVEAGLAGGGWAAYNYFQREDINLVEKSYAVADYLAGQARNNMNTGDVIKVEVFKQVYQPETSSQIGKVIPQQIGSRLSQLGYIVNLDDVRTAEGGQVMGKAAHGRKPEFILAGQYTRGDDDLGISTRIVQISTGRVIAAFEYKLPMTREVKELSEPETRIYRVQ